MATQPKQRHQTVSMEDVCVYTIPGLFAALMLIMLIPMIMNEPYGRELVGVRLDAGSKLFTMTAPYLGRVALVFIGGALIIWAVVKLLQTTGLVDQLMGGGKVTWTVVGKPRAA